MSKCICGVEVKSSLWHYAKRRASSQRPLSITIKDEELQDIDFWTNKFSKPLLFVQSFIDELYAASYIRLKTRMVADDCSIRTESRTKKKTYMFPIGEAEPLLAEIKVDFSAFNIKADGGVVQPAHWPQADLRFHLTGFESLL
jgi:hypothetical protein